MKKIFVLAPIALVMALAGNAQAATQADVMLQGSIVDTTCEVTANNGAAALNVGSFGKTTFTTAKAQVGSEPLVVTLANCNEDEIGALQVTGLVVGADNTIFVNDISQPAGFMLKEADGTTQVANGTSIPVTANATGNLSYSFEAGMAVFNTASVIPGAYNAPIKISYVNN